MGSWDDDFNGDDVPTVCWVHDWVGVQLIRSTLYHCSKCGKKKEEYEEEKQKEEEARKRYNENWD